MLRNPRVLLVCVGLLAALLAAASLHYFTHNQTLEALSGGIGLNAPEQETLEADNVQVVGHSGGKVRWRLGAQTVTLSRDRRTLAVTGIHRAALYSSANRPAVMLTADHASYAAPFGVMSIGGGGTLRLAGNVRAHLLTPAAPSVATQLLLWDSSSNTLLCPSALTATLPKLVVSAGSAQYSSPPGALAHGVMGLAGGVHARFDSTHGIAVLDCPGLTWNADAEEARTTGPVSALIPGGLGTAHAADIEVSTRTGDLSAHSIAGTLRLSSVVQ